MARPPFLCGGWSTKNTSTLAAIPCSRCTTTCWKRSPPCKRACRSLSWIPTWPSAKSFPSMEDIPKNAGWWKFHGKSHEHGWWLGVLKWVSPILGNPHVLMLIQLHYVDMGCSWTIEATTVDIPIPFGHQTSLEIFPHSMSHVLKIWRHHKTM